MELESLIETFPKLYHMTHLDAWPGIQRHGLLSTSALLDLFEINGMERHSIESCRRRDNVKISHRVHGQAVIRDNKPMDDARLQRALTGSTPQAWYELLNRKVFFWLTEDRVKILLSAAAYRAENHCVLTISTRSLVLKHVGRISLCPMNSGCTRPYPHARGPYIFSKISDYPFDKWRKKKGGARKAIVELAVDGAVPDIIDHVELVCIENQKGIIREVWRR